jgi:acyl-CoA synthetase (NDP forming)
MAGSFVPAIVQMGFAGPVYPVNPRYQEIHGLKCYPRLLDVPGDVDYVISSVPAAVVPQLVEESGRKGVRAIHFFTAGFSETGEEERAELEENVIERAKALGIRVIGPNCMGLYVPEAGLAFSGGFPREKGTVALVSQSGANASEFVSSGAQRGLRYSKVISYGNAADLCEADFFDYLAGDPDTEVIASYIEGVRDGRRFVAALKKAARAKPVAILKGGRTEAGGRATRSHTASLAGPIAVFDGLCRQAGAVRVESMEELVDMAIAFRTIGRLPGPRAGVIVGGGGRSVLTADEVNSEGLEVPPLTEETQRQLREFTPIAGTSIRNPVDTMAGWGGNQEEMRRTLEIVAGAPNLDFVLYMGGGPPGPWRGGPAGPHDPPFDPAEAAQRQVRGLAEAQAAAGKPIVVVAGTPSNAEGLAYAQALSEEAMAGGIAVFASARRAAVALARLRLRQRLLAD